MSPPRKSFAEDDDSVASAVEFIMLRNAAPPAAPDAPAAPAAPAALPAREAPEGGVSSARVPARPPSPAAIAPAAPAASAEIPSGGSGSFAGAAVGPKRGPAKRKVGRPSTATGSRVARNFYLDQPQLGKLYHLQGRRRQAGLPYTACDLSAIVRDAIMAFEDHRTSSGS